MSSSAEVKEVKDKRPRGPPLESEELKEVKRQKEADQQARTNERVALYTELAREPSVELERVARVEALRKSGVLQDPAGWWAAVPTTTAGIESIDLTEGAGVWKGQLSSFGLTLTRGPGERLVLIESSYRPGEWCVQYDPPLPEEESSDGPD